MSEYKQGNGEMVSCAVMVLAIWIIVVRQSEYMHSSSTLQKGCVHPSHVVMDDNLLTCAVGSSIWLIQWRVMENEGWLLEREPEKRWPH